jgi:hypothetical protein
MEQEKTNFIPKPLLFAAFVTFGHFAAVIWHLLLLVEVQPGTPRIALLLLILINLLPVAALVAFAKGRYKLAGGLIVVPLGVALAIGGYTHFLSAGTDNVLQMPPGELRLPFQVSAVLLAVLEVLGCWIGLWIFTYRRDEHPLKS